MIAEVSQLYFDLFIFLQNIITFFSSQMYFYFYFYLFTEHDLICLSFYRTCPSCLHKDRASHQRSSLPTCPRFFTTYLFLIFCGRGKIMKRCCHEFSVPIHCLTIHKEQPDKCVVCKEPKSKIFCF